ncbi:MAG: DUF1848 domain-containing protein [Desulfomonile tiedjei]|nr:DUF1848 domain-containing protein [Desulfomonile tiedjei]
MHVVSASRRTDIPSFHAEWFMQRIREGFVRVLSPFGGGVLEVSLAPEDVIAIVFWTKNAAPILPHLEELRNLGHCFTFLYTINNYPAFVEPAVPEWGHTKSIVEQLSKRFPQAAFRWRYDTIVLGESLDWKWHVRNFRGLCRSLAPYATECIFSFCDYYRKTTKNMERGMPDHWKPGEAQCKEMAEEMAAVAKEWGISVASCAHDFLMSDNVAKAKCIDPAFLARVVDSPERLAAVTDLKRAPTRKDCGCAASRDVGAYDTCLHGCLYCYANANPETAARNVEFVRKDSACLDPRAAGVTPGTDIRIGRNNNTAADTCDKKPRPRGGVSSQA